MILFSKKIKTEKIVETLVSFLDRDYDLLKAELRKLFEKEQKVIGSTQNRELLAILMFSTTRSILSALGGLPETETIIGEFQHSIFYKYFVRKKPREEFQNLFWERYERYSQIMSSGSGEIVIYLGGEFSRHLFGDEEVDLSVAILIGGSSISIMTSIAGFLNEVRERFKIVL